MTSYRRSILAAALSTILALPESRESCRRFRIIGSPHSRHLELLRISSFFPSPPIDNSEEAGRLYTVHFAVFLPLSGRVCKRLLGRSA